MEFVPVQHATFQSTIEKLQIIFATHELPEILIRDNSTTFTSAEFQEFMARNSIRHALTSPYHLTSNGLAERVVQSFKAAMRKMSTGPIVTQIARILFHQCLTPHTTILAIPQQSYSYEEGFIRF